MNCATKSKPKKYKEGGEAISAEEKATRARLIQEAKDEEMAPKLEEAYNKSLRNTEMSPKKEASKKESSKKEPVNKAKGGMVKGYASGGLVKARGMGAATRGGKCKVC